MSAPPHRWQDALVSALLALIAALAVGYAAAWLGPVYPVTRARTLALGWALVAFAALMGALLAREGSLLARMLGGVGIYALAAEGYAALAPRTWWFVMRHAAEHGADLDDLGAARQIGDFLASTVVAGLAAACVGLAIALWRPRRGTAAAAGLILFVLGAALAATWLAQPPPRGMI